MLWLARKMFWKIHNRFRFVGHKRYYWIRTSRYRKRYRSYGRIKYEFKILRSAIFAFIIVLYTSFIIIENNCPSGFSIFCDLIYNYDSLNSDITFLDSLSSVIVESEFIYEYPGYVVFDCVLFIILLNLMYSIYFVVLIFMVLRWYLLRRLEFRRKLRRSIISTSIVKTHIKRGLNRSFAIAEWDSEYDDYQYYSPDKYAFSWIRFFFTHFLFPQFKMTYINRYDPVPSIYRDYRIIKARRILKYRNLRRLGIPVTPKQKKYEFIRQQNIFYRKIAIEREIERDAWVWLNTLIERLLKKKALIIKERMILLKDSKKNRRKKSESKEKGIA